MSNSDRPLSPHLHIYRPQITTVLSILHRITGAGMALGTLVLAWWLFAALYGEETFSYTQQFRDSFIGQFMLFCWLFAFCYHCLNGIRHLVWDTGRGFEIKNVTQSGWAVVIGALFLTLAFGWRIFHG